MRPPMQSLIEHPQCCGKDMIPTGGGAYRCADYPKCWGEIREAVVTPLLHTSRSLRHVDDVFDAEGNWVDEADHYSNYDYGDQ